MKTLLITIIFLLPLGLFAQFNTYNPNNSADLNLTDEQRAQSKTYVNKGLEQAAYQTLCEGIETECQGMEGKEKFLGVPNQMVEMLGKAYTMIIGMSGAPLEISPEAHAKNLKEDPTASRTRPDYCAKIPMAGETMSQFVQQSEQKNMQNLPSIGDTDQKQQLFKAARSHEVRATTSTIQATTYGASSACYLGMVTLGGVQASEVALKLPATALLTGFYTKNAIQQKDMADKIKGIADRLPGPGDCNPITQKKCFCDNYIKLRDVARKWDIENTKNREKTKKFNEELADKGFLNTIGSFLGLGEDYKVHRDKIITLDTASYEKYCQPLYHNNQIAPGSQRTACLDFKGQPDAFCDCLQTSSCMDKTFISNIKGIGKAPYTDAALSDLVSLSRGELSGGDLNGGDIGSFAAGKGALRKLALQFKPVPLNDEQKLSAKIAEKVFGVPKEMAAHLARAPLSPSDRKAGERILKQMMDGMSTKVRLGSSGKRSGNNLDDVFYKGNTAAAQMNRKRAQIMEKRKQIAKKPTGINSGVLQFAQRATSSSSAQIHKRKSVSVFQIISRRYQMVTSRGLLSIPDSAF